MIWVLFERGALGTQAGSQRLIRRGRAGTARTRSTGAHRGTGASGALDLGFSPVGARIRKKVSGKTATSFGNYIRRQTPGLRPRRRYTAGDALEDWLAHGVDERSERTVKLYRGTIVKALNEELGKVRLMELTVVELR